MSWWDFESSSNNNTLSALGLDRSFIVPVEPNETDVESYRYSNATDNEGVSSPWTGHKRNKSASTEISRPETFTSYSRYASAEKWVRCYSSTVLFILSFAFVSFLVITFKPNSDNRHRITQPSEFNSTFSVSDMIPAVFPRHYPWQINQFTSTSFPSTSPSLDVLFSFTTPSPSFQSVNAPALLPSRPPMQSPSLIPTLSEPSSSPSNSPSHVLPTISPSTLRTQHPSQTPTSTIPPTKFPTTPMWSTEITTTPAGRCALPKEEFWSTKSQLFHARIHVLDLQSSSSFSAEICWRIYPRHKPSSCRILFNRQQGCTFNSNPCEKPEQNIAVRNITFEQDHFEFTLVENNYPEADFALHSFQKQDTSSLGCQSDSVFAQNTMPPSP